MTGWRSPLLDWPAAVAGSGAEEGVAAHYGDPFREQRAMEESAAVVDRSAWEVVAVTGLDRRAWLHSLLSQDVAGLPDWGATSALLLDAQGRVEQHLDVVDDGATTWLVAEPSHGAALAAFLDRMRFLLAVAVRLDTAGTLLTVAGPDSAAVLARAGMPVVGEGGAAPSAYGWVRGRSWPVGAVDLWIPRERVADVAATLRTAGAVPAGLLAWEACRVAAGVARLGHDTDDRTIPHEAGWVGRAVHLTKGCYRGQETVARVHALGRAPRRLVRVHLDGSSEVLPPPGTVLRQQGRPVGFVGTVVRHRTEGQIGLALVRRATADDLPCSCTLEDGHVVAVAIEPGAVPDEELPGAGAGRRAQEGLRGADPRL